MISSFPPENPDLHFQTELKSIDNSDFIDGITPIKSSIVDRVIQIIMFIVCFGWLRLFILFLMTILFIILELPILFFPGSEYIKKWGVFVASTYLRGILFCFGLIYIRKTGEIENNTRVFAFNHVTLFDGPVVFLCKQFRIVSMIEMSRIPLVNSLMRAISTIFIDRTIKNGSSKCVDEAIRDNNSLPVGIAPEGKTCKGTYMFKFHTSAFISNYRFQPVSIRYRTLLGFGKIGYSWTVGGIFEFIWRCSCVPFGIAEVHFLPSINPNTLNNKSAEERAIICQLAIANDLGVLASNRSNREIYKKKLKTK